MNLLPKTQLVIASTKASGPAVDGLRVVMMLITITVRIPIIHMAPVCKAKEIVEDTN